MKIVFLFLSLLVGAGCSTASRVERNLAQSQRESVAGRLVSPFKQLQLRDKRFIELLTDIQSPAGSPIYSIALTLTGSSSDQALSVVRSDVNPSHMPDQDWQRKMEDTVRQKLSSEQSDFMLGTANIVVQDFIDGKTDISEVDTFLRRLVLKRK